MDPFRETAGRRLMRVLADAGNRGEALGAYAECRALLKKELGVMPSAETEKIAKALR